MTVSFARSPARRALTRPAWTAVVPVIVGVGIDVCDVERFAATLARRPGLVARLFTPAEAERPVASLAARFAAKEALAKALGAPQGMSWQDAEIVTDERGRPRFAVRGTVAARAEAARDHLDPRQPLPRRGHRVRRRRVRRLSLDPG